ncbi:PREDICTED: leucoanthocyanidin dioxygenase-like [Tarenaya hassleriana]|uniref:leucoanthocyanidin dioxygenase-like n=1 Tax=Tarenaya hassleriana TaxID=28532 RepID=UPI00053CA4AF|nr:PREDICTED: leucoanthocyanidin dioxygenase-like [Tarenaya hassleriana]
MNVSSQTETRTWIEKEFCPIAYELSHLILDLNLFFYLTHLTTSLSPPLLSSSPSDQHKKKRAKTMMNMFQDWPEPVVRVQSLSESNLETIPGRYIKPPSLRPTIISDHLHTIPVIDLSSVYTDDITLREETLAEISRACREWGFFQVVNHGVSPRLMERAKEAWREFFHLPMEIKQVHANSPVTYEGYGSRLGVEKDAPLDWCDYYFLHYLPSSLKDYTKWPSSPPNCREIIEDYCKEQVELCEKLMKILSINLGLNEDRLQNAFGGTRNAGACMRVNYYPKCPQPELTLGLSPHSDPGGLTVLLPDDHVPGLQVRRSDHWVIIKPDPHALIVNIGDQIQVLSNAIYKSVEHRVVVSSARERGSLAFFYNPKGDIPMEPLRELLTENSPAFYSPMTFDQYRLFIRTRGPQSKSHVDLLRSPR